MLNENYAFAGLFFLECVNKYRYDLSNKDIFALMVSKNRVIDA